MKKVKVDGHSTKSGRSLENQVLKWEMLKRTVGIIQPPYKTVEILRFTWTGYSDDVIDHSQKKQ